MGWGWWKVWFWTEATAPLGYKPREKYKRPSGPHVTLTSGRIIYRRAYSLMALCCRVRSEMCYNIYEDFGAYLNKRDWFSGKILRCHQQRRGALGSIPRSRIVFCVRPLFLVSCLL